METLEAGVAALCVDDAEETYPFDEAARLALGRGACSVDLSPDGSQALVAVGFKGVVLLDVDTRTEKDYRSLIPGSYFRNAFFLEDWRNMAVSMDGFVNLMFAGASPHNRVSEHGDFIVSAASKDGRFFAMSRGHLIYLFDARTGACLKVLSIDADLFLLAFSPDGTLLVASGQKMAWLWSTTEPHALVRAFSISQVYTVNFDIAISPDNAMVVLCMSDGIRAWSTRTGELLFVMDEYSTNNFAMSFAFLDDGKAFLVGTRHGALVLHRTRTRAVIRHIDHFRLSVSGISVSRDGRRIAACSDFGEVCVWTINKK